MTSKENRTPLPFVDSIDPSSVKQNSTDKITINGRNFPGYDADGDLQSAVLVEDPDQNKLFFLEPTYVSAIQLEVALITDFTGVKGNKTIKVHSLDNGDLSNGVTLVVE